MISGSFVYSQGFELGILATGQNDSFDPTRTSTLHTSSKTPLKLPFWDDFSQSSPVPKSKLWYRSNDVQISPTLGINNITINVAVFNGINAQGRPHNPTQFQNGDTDKLTSNQIDLSTYDASSGLFLSFFYEKKGNGELPDDNDGLRVEFMNKDSVWVTGIWRKYGQDVSKINRFYQVMLPITDTQFFSNKFRFRFVANGRQAGLFDTWMVDYVYLNSGRTANSPGIQDRSFTKHLSSPLVKYYAMPIDHFVEGNSLRHIDKSQSQYFHQKNGGLVNQLIMKSYVHYVLPNKTVVNSPKKSASTPATGSDRVNGVNTDNYRANFFYDKSQLAHLANIPTNATYAELRLGLSGNAWAEGKIPHLNLNINDTTSRAFVLHNYYAYDDGSAERGAGVNGTGSQIAYKYQMATDRTDTLTAIDIYFPSNIVQDQRGKKLTLKIWDVATDGTPSKVLMSRKISVKVSNTLNEYQRYKLPDSLKVKKSFFIGWEQSSVGRIYVGLDKNTNSEANIYYNIAGEWSKNTDDIVGSLMVRPVFNTPTLVIASLNENRKSKIVLYPNPTNGILYIEGNIDQIELYNIQGTKVPFEWQQENQKVQINFSDLPKGIYVLKAKNKERYINKKIVLE